jgi:hypothetical protein
MPLCDGSDTWELRQRLYDSFRKILSCQLQE